MAHARIFLRIAKPARGDLKIEANAKKIDTPLRDSSGKFLPTVILIQDIDIPDEAFRPPNIFIAMKLPAEKVEPIVQVIDPAKLLEDPKGANR